MLDHSVVRHAPEADVAVRPWLRAAPLDRVVEVLGLLQAEGSLTSGTSANPSPVDANDRVAVRHPVNRVDRLVNLVGQAVRVAGKVAVLQLLLLARVVVVANTLVVEALAVGAHVHDHGVSALGGRQEHIGVDKRPVAKRYLHVGHLHDAQDVAAYLVAGRLGCHERARRPSGEHARRVVQPLQQAEHVGVFREIAPLRGEHVHELRVDLSLVEVDDRGTDDVVDFRRYLHAVLNHAILIKRVQQARQVGEQRVG